MSPPADESITPTDALADVPTTQATGLSRDAKRRLEQQRFFGTDFPDLKREAELMKQDDGDEKAGQRWRKWINSRIGEQESVMRDKRLHWARHHHFRVGRQWISTRDGRTWREMDADKNTIRAVADLIGPALDFRLAIISEQRPGFRAHPQGTGIDAKETAEAQQSIAEFYYNKLNGQKLSRDSQSQAQTDGVSFLRVFVDKQAGPKRQDVKVVAQDDERFFSLQAQGYKENADGNLEIPINENGDEADPGVEPRRFSTGDIRTDILRAHEVWFDPEARTINGPFHAAKWAIIRRVRDLEAARLETGNPDLESEGAGFISDPILDSVDVTGSPQLTSGFQRGLPPFPSVRRRSRNTKTVFEFYVYIAPNAKAGIPKGIFRRVVSNVLIKRHQELPGGKIPLARMTDGSSDPELFPRPVMSSWIPDQLTINSLVSKLIEHVRIYGTGRTIAQKGTVIEETYTNIVGSLLKYVGQKPEFLQGVRVSGDVWQSIQFFVKKLEDKTGWNDLARGQVTGSGSFQDVSGRALLGARELFERQFGPMIRATAEGMSDWAVLVVDYARWLFETPRLIPITGRGDLAKRIEAKNLGEESLVFMDPETLSPLPRALRNQMLFDLLEKQLITVDEYRKRAPFAEIRSIHMGDVANVERAQLVNTIIEEQWERLAGLAPEERFDPAAGGVAIMWQDEPSVHKNALLEIALDELKEFDMRALAIERWGIYDQLERAKTIDPNTGMPTAAIPPVVLGVPPDLQPPPPEEQLAAEAGFPPGTEAPGAFGMGAPLASPAPDLSPEALPAAAQQELTPLGQFGAVEAAATAPFES